MKKQFILLLMMLLPVMGSASQTYTDAQGVVYTLIEEGSCYAVTGHTTMANTELSTSRAEAVYSNDMSQSFIFDNEALSVDGVASKSADNRPVYKLNGQRYAGHQAKKGTILIKGGKKYF